MKQHQVPWQPYQLRFSLIGLEDGIAKPDLGDLFGVEVEDTTYAGPQKDLRQSAMLGAGQLTLSATQARMDFVWQSLPPTEDFFRLGDLLEAVPHLLNPIRALIGAHSWGRVAFGAVCGARVADRIEGYGQLNERLDEVEVDGANSADFLYQVNKPVQVQCGSNAIILNRLHKWNVARIKFLGLTPDIETAEALPAFLDILVSQVTLDFNTSSEMVVRLTGEESLAVIDYAIQDAAQLIGR